MKKRIALVVGLLGVVIAALAAAASAGASTTQSCVFTTKNGNMTVTPKITSIPGKEGQSYTNLAEEAFNRRRAAVKRTARVRNPRYMAILIGY